MCPPAFIPPVADLDDFPTNEGFCKFFIQIKSGYSLPDNVLTEVDPFQYLPSNYPGDTWYLWSGPKTELDSGFWKSTGEAYEIHSTPMVSCFRKTFEFFEGRAPHGQKTNWIMQKYTTTDKFINEQDPTALYKVFSVNESSSGQLPKSQLLEKNVDDGAGPSAMGDHIPDLDGDFLEWDDLLSPLQRSPVSGDVGDHSPRDDDYIEMDDLDSPLPRSPVSGDVGDYGPRDDDYIGLDDLDIPPSPTTSTCTDSSGMTMSMTSDAYFDSDALMRDLEDDNGGQGNQEPRVNLHLSAPAKLKEVVVHTETTTLGSVDGDKEDKPPTGEITEAGPTPENEIGETSNRINTMTPSPSTNSEASSHREEKQLIVNRTKKRSYMKYFCSFFF